MQDEQEAAGLAKCRYTVALAVIQVDPKGDALLSVPALARRHSYRAQRPRPRSPRYRLLYNTSQSHSGYVPAISSC